MADLVPADPSADSAPAPPVVTDTDALDAATSAERRTWELTGELPSGESTAADETPSEPTPADSDPAPPVEQAASTDASPEPDSTPGEPGKQNAETRKAELAADIQELLAERAALRQETRGLKDDRPAEIPDARKADSSPAADDRRPTQEDYPDDYEAYIVALSQWGARQEHTKLQGAQQAKERADAHFSEFDGVVKAARARLDAATAADPTFTEKVDPNLITIEPASVVPADRPIAAENVMAEQILRSDMTAPLLMHFTEHPDDFQRFCTLTPSNLFRNFGRLEATLAATATPAETPTPTKVVTTAPAPPTTLGRKPATQPDPVQAALTSGDFRAYEAEMNRADIRANS